MIIREAKSQDWSNLSEFYRSIYREHHPLHNRDFWEWQYGDKIFGRSFICINSENKIVGHVGANFQGGLAWIINVFLDSNYRGQGILGKLYNLAREYYPLAATAANEAGLGLYRNMGWIRYYNLVRYVAINPLYPTATVSEICQPINVEIEQFNITDTHYFRQPTITGLILNDGSRAVSQEDVGGLRVLSIEDLQNLECQAWELGYKWMDFITSWNDLNIKKLEASGWLLDYKTVVPWQLNPLNKDYFCDITFLSEEPLPKDFIVHRNHSDHGRIGSIKN